MPLPSFSDDAVLARRPARNPVDPSRPYAFLVESEFARSGRCEPVATLFLTNRECPFRCLMCDLWKNTTEESVPPGSIPAQIDYALERLPAARHIKLYNSGNFFDHRAIRAGDHPAIAARVSRFESVIVENHPKLCSPDVFRFRDSLGGAELEVAMGLETIHPDVLPRLNKQMTTGDFAAATRRLVAGEVRVRAFVLLRPPFLNEEQGIDWAVRSVQFAFAAGVECCALIPTRGGNGILERLQREGHFQPPCLESLERAMEACLRLRQGRVLADLWDVRRLPACESCRTARQQRLQEMNATQRIGEPVSCRDCRAGV